MDLIGRIVDLVIFVACVGHRSHLLGRPTQLAQQSLGVLHGFEATVVANETCQLAVLAHTREGLARVPPILALYLGRRLGYWWSFRRFWRLLRRLLAAHDLSLFSTSIKYYYLFFFSINV